MSNLEQVEEKSAVSRWINRQRKESPQKIEAFLDAYEKICRDHGLCLSHEDGHGGFLVHRFNDDDVSWVRYAAVEIPEEQL